MSTTPLAIDLPARPTRGRRAYLIAAIALAALALLVYAWINVGGSLSDLVNGLFSKKGIRGIISDSLPPDGGQIAAGFRASVTTFCIAWLSIVVGAIASVLLLPFAARNLAPNRVVYEVVRAVVAVLRAIPELIMLILFLAAVGITPFAAVLALIFHGIGVKGKLYAEAVEEMDMAPVDALRVAGASRAQVFLHGVLPGVRNTLIGLTLYRLDANFRSAVTLGVIGGGGIGFLIDNQFNDFQFRAVATYMIIMVVWVLVIERVSAVLRARL